MHSFKIERLDIHQSYFVGKVKLGDERFTINIQNERRGKIVKLPFQLETEKQRVLVRLAGKKDLFVEDYITYDGKSEWVEIDSDEITYFIADHQDELDTLEILD